MKKRIPRKYDFTKKWPSLNYEALDDEKLIEQIDKIKDDTKKQLEIVKKWPNFLKEFGELHDELERLFNKANDFYVKHLIRKHYVEESTTLFFIKEKFNMTDLYFDNKENEKKFLNIYEKTAKAFVNLHNFYIKKSPGYGKYFLPNKTENMAIFKHTEWKHGPINNPNRKGIDLGDGADVLEYSYKWKKTRRVCNILF